MKKNWSKRSKSAFTRQSVRKKHIYFAKDAAAGKIRRRTWLLLSVNQVDLKAANSGRCGCIQCTLQYKKRGRTGDWGINHVNPRNTLIKIRQLTKGKMDEQSKVVKWNCVEKKHWASSPKSWKYRFTGKRALQKVWEIESNVLWYGNQAAIGKRVRCQEPERVGIDVGYYFIACSLKRRRTKNLINKTLLKIFLKKVSILINTHARGEVVDLKALAVLYRMDS